MKLFKKQIRYLGYIECPTWLWNLIDKHAKKINNLTDYSEWYKSIFYYDNERFDLPKKDPMFVETYDQAKQIIDAKKFNYIKKEIDEFDLDVSIEEMPKEIKRLKEQIEELKNLPPVEIEKISWYDIYPPEDPRSKFHEDWKKSVNKK